MNNININSITNIISPKDLKLKYPINDNDIEFIENSRKTVKDIMKKTIKKKIIIVGPCSIHDYQLTIDYANFLKKMKEKYPKNMIIMRMYFEKPRTITGWKGFLYDPDINETNNIEKGLELTRQLLIEITKMKIPIATEFLDTIIPQYIDDLITWGCIGARTTESQLHRQLASGLTIPIGFKNSTSGDIEIAINASKSAAVSHSFLSVDENGKVSIVHTKGNQNTGIVLRGSNKTGSNIMYNNINKHSNIIIDLSHDNTLKDGKKDFKEQINNVDVILQLLKNNTILNNNLDGIMIESNIKSGNQPITSHLEYGISITDKCLDLIDTEQIFQKCDNF